MKSIFLFALYLVCCNVINAQQTKFSGYILDQKGDSIRGFVKYQSYTKSQRRCWFSEGGKVFNEYSPSDLRGYGLENATQYRSKTLPNGETVFLEIFYQGEYSLYTMKVNGSSWVYYVERPDDRLIQLRVKEINNGTRNLIINEYQDVLISMLPDDEEIGRKILFTNLNRESLSQLFALFDEKQGNSFRTFGGSFRTPVYFSAVAGMNQSVLSFETQPGEANSSNLAIGLGISKELSRASGRLWFELELQLNKRDYDQFFTRPFVFAEEINGLTEEINLPINPVPTVGPPEYAIDLDYSASYLSAPLMIKYVIPIRGLRLSLAGGYQPVIALNQDFFARETIIRSGFVVFFDKSHIDILPSWQNSYVLGLGLSLGEKFPLEFIARYSSQVEIAGGNGGLIGINKLQFLVKVPFNWN